MDAIVNRARTANEQLAGIDYGHLGKVPGAPPLSRPHPGLMYLAPLQGWIFGSTEMINWQEFSGKEMPEMLT